MPQILNRYTTYDRNQSQRVGPLAMSPPKMLHLGMGPPKMLHLGALGDGESTGTSVYATGFGAWALMLFSGLGVGASLALLVGAFRKGR